MDPTTITTTTTTAAPVEIQIVLPPWFGQITAFGVSVGATVAVVQMVARKWLAYSPLLRRLFPRLFAGQWDEVIDRVALLIQRTDIRFADLSAESVKSALRDPDTLAALLTSEACLSRGEDGRLAIQQPQQARKQQQRRFFWW